MKPVLVAEAPGRRGDPARPLDGRPGRLLLTWAGWETDGEPWRLLAERFDVRNLLGEYPGRGNGKGTAWRRDEARAAGLETDFRGRPATVLLGRRVADAFGIGGAEFWEWRSPGVVECPHVVVPHPSGIVRAYNAPEARALTGAILREAAE